MNKTEIDNDNDENKKMNFNKSNIIKMIHKSPKIKKAKLIHNNIYNITRHKKVLSSKEKLDVLKTYKSNCNINNKRKNNKMKSYTVSRTLKSNKKINNNNKNFDTEINPLSNKHMRKNVNIKYQYDRFSKKMSKSNKNMPVYSMQYSYNDIYQEQKNKNKL